MPHSTGRRLDAVTNYAAFVMLARIRPDPPGGTAPTVLSLFTAGQAARPAD